jgi:putative hydrolase of the HAD superfamily
MIEALVFDLDDTLYVESDYVTSGYRAVARYVSKEYGCSFKDVHYAMMSVFASQGRHMVFPVLIERFLESSVPVSELVEVYRRHVPKIRLFPGYLSLLRSLGGDYRLGVITDGLPEVQKRKVRALGLEDLLDKIVYTWEYGAENEKPHPLGFSMMLGYLGVKPQQTIFVGDNPSKDCTGARRVGIKCAQVQMPNSKMDVHETEARADFVIDSLFQLPPILRAAVS